jgi:hypothetical protein
MPKIPPSLCPDLHYLATRAQKSLPPQLRPASGNWRKGMHAFATHLSKGANAHVGSLHNGRAPPSMIQRLS